MSPPEETVEARIDGLDGADLIGWARAAGELAALRLEVLLDGEPFAAGVADQPRGDLLEAGLGPCAFRISLPEPAGDGAAELRLRVAGGATLGAVLPVDRAALRRAAWQLSRAPVRIGGPYAGFVEHIGPGALTGWVSVPDAPRTRPGLILTEAGETLAATAAGIWRKDLEETRQGDGRWGFAFTLPARLRDGRLHEVMLADADSGAPLLAAPLRLSFPSDAPAPPPAPPQADKLTRSTRLRPPIGAVPEGVFLSVVVVFHRMRREAARTLTSLARAYQRDIGALGYEVICIDNDAEPGLAPGFVEGFGPEFRLFRPAAAHPSPVAAINAAAATARGRYLAIMIDGAHILSPGVLRETFDTLADAPDAIVALRQWSVGGDQRFFASQGYTREQEDILFDRIAWPTDGYRLFGISMPTWESANHWLDGMIESNFLVVPRPIWQALGGMDPRFDAPGAGYANLDLFRRACLASPEPVIALVGEASFHQFHGGTTTNVDDEEKDRRVRAYEMAYAAIRGETYPGTEFFDVRVRGQIKAGEAVSSRERPSSPARVGITPAIRRTRFVQVIDDRVEDFLRCAYVEGGLAEQTSFLGHKLAVAPADALALQEVVRRVRPGRIVAVNAPPGVLALLDGAVRLLDLPCAIASIGAAVPEGTRHVRVLDGDLLALATSAALDRFLGTEEHVLVVLQPAAGDTLPAPLLRAWARHVSLRSYLVCLNTTSGQPWLGYSTRFWLKAIKLLLDEGEFVPDHALTGQIITTCAWGFLQRIAARAAEEA